MAPRRAGRVEAVEVRLGDETGVQELVVLDRAGMGVST
jgi:hypothetical protein